MTLFSFSSVGTTASQTTPQTTGTTTIAFTTTVICPLTEGMSPSQNINPYF
jgi:hypothetical protein